MIDFCRFTHLTFDCYGTLIDWETGILRALGAMFERHGASADESRVLDLYAELEAAQEEGPYKRYREVLRAVTAGIATRSGITPTERDLDALPDSIGGWPPFPDTIEALARLKGRYKLAVISNVDDDLFAMTNRTLGSPFHDVITAQQVGSYKPSPRNFRFALEKLGATASEVLHVAQSLYHDHVPAKALGFTTVWVNRPSRRRNVGLALPVGVRPDLEVTSMAGLVDAIDRPR
jgi:2-haloacid dehalogenase